MDQEWFEVIGRPRFVVAPMVDASELAWRILSRRHGATLCYTPMLHSTVFTKDPKYRKENFTTCKEDRPLVVQFCGNNPETMAAAAKYVEKDCDAIDINLGCPQSIAKRGKYGSFLQDEWQLLREMISAMSKAVSVPITCKVRVFESIEKSVQYALMLQEAGCRLLTVHGRTRDQKGPLTGIASWKHIKAIREAISIPMFANGNIQSLEDVHRCLDYTKVDGVMSAEGNLTNPAIFEGINPVSWEIALEYIELVEKYPCPTSYIRGHLFKIFHKVFTFKENNEEREILATAQCLDDFKKVCIKIRDKYCICHEGNLVIDDNEGVTRYGYNLILPPWICQPYVRMSPEEHTQKMERLVNNQISVKFKLSTKLRKAEDCIKANENTPIHNYNILQKSFKNNDNNNDTKRTNEDLDGNTMSRKKMKKMKRIMRRPAKTELHGSRSGDICVNTTCPNPLGGKCEYQLCKKCCRNKCFEENLDCKGHRILVRTRKEMALSFAQKVDIVAS